MDSSELEKLERVMGEAFYADVVRLEQRVAELEDKLSMAMGAVEENYGRWRQEQDRADRLQSELEEREWQLQQFVSNFD